MQTLSPSIHDLEVGHVYDATGLRIGNQPHKRSKWETRLVSVWGQGQHPEWVGGTGICKGCRTAIDSTPTVVQIGGAPMEFPSTVCEDCMALVRIHYDPRANTETQVTQTPRWDAACPQRFRDVVMGYAKPTGIDTHGHDTVSAWTPAGNRGLIAIGPPGVGKSCAFWNLARELEVAGHAPIVLGSLELARTLGEAAKDIREVGWLYRSKILMVDDLGKERATPAVAALFWEVLDRRLAAGFHSIFTTNFEGSQFAARFGEQHLGDSIRRRIAESCKVIRFKPPTP